jgi:Competence protein CoiA-like family
MKPQNALSDHEPMYGWAFDSKDKPVPISAAKRGERYFCPVCRGDVVAKLGDIKMHHFAHVTLVQCTPDNVARAAAGSWLTEELKRLLAEKQAVTLDWQLQGQTYQVNLLNKVARIERDYSTGTTVGDLVLLDESGKMRAIILLGLNEQKPDMNQVSQWTQNGSTVILLNPANVRSGQMELKPLLEQSQIMGGWWLMDQNQMPENLVMDAAKIREILTLAAKQPPHFFYGQLESEAALTHLLRVGQHKLWLPPDYWREIVGGTKNHLGPDIDVIIQEWAQPDNGKLMLFYISVKNNNAVAVRHYNSEDEVRLHVTGQFRLLQFTAIDLAKQFAGGSMELPK